MTEVLTSLYARARRSTLSRCALVRPIDQPRTLTLIALILTLTLTLTRCAQLTSRDCQQTGFRKVPVQRGCTRQQTYQMRQAVATATSSLGS